MVLQASDGSESLSQFIGDRIITQFANNLGNLALAFPSVANSVLFANGATNASPAAVQQFSQMVTPALAIASSSLGNELQLLPHGTSLISSLQNSIFGTSTGATGSTSTSPTSLFTALQDLPTGSVDFASAVPTIFSTAFSNLAGMLNQFVGTFPSPNITLPTEVANGSLSPSFTGSTFQSGFLGGFGSGFTGFGTAPTTLNTNFGTGFNNFVSTTNSGMGFSTPIATTSAGTVGVTPGTGTIGTGTTSGNGASV